MLVSPYQVVNDAWWHILNDKYMWLPVWGKPRVGKTTFKMRLAFAIYKDWDKVLGSIVFNLGGLIYKIQKGEPQRIWTRNQLHNRVPIILFDDWGGTSNKATTQYDKGWDVFKGAFDLLGTHVTILAASMVEPTEPTFQLQLKYTHEVWIPVTGWYKYDKVDWQQDYRGWQPGQRKVWVETQRYGMVPADVYKQYNEMRMALVEEAFVRVTDATAESQLEVLLKRLQPSDIQLMEMLQTWGPSHYDKIMNELGVDGKDVLVRCKARNLVIPIKITESGYYKYDLTDFALVTLEAIRKNRSIDQKQDTTKKVGTS